MNNFSKPKGLLLFCLIINICFSCTKIDAEAPLTGDDKALAVTAFRPNIILIMMDDVGYEIPQYSGGESFTTPAMNSIAANGMQFTHCYAAATCTPSRVCLLTGKYGFRNYYDWGIMDTSQKTIANMLKNIGYKTCVSGKWQLDGGDASIRKFGFDRYSVFDPTEDRSVPDEEENMYRYKNPTIFQDGAYLPEANTLGRYADDIFTNYAANFIVRNKANPFFVYFSFSACHKPYSPPPSNIDFAAWDPLTSPQNKRYFPDMVAYMDSKIATLVNVINSQGLAQKTYIFVMGDNGTPSDIQSNYKGRKIRGGKGSTNEFGLHVPFLALGPSIQPNSVSRGIVDFSDFMPTIANLAKVPPTIMANFGIMDGNSFHKQLLGEGSIERTSSYCYYFPNRRASLQKRIYVQDTTYKLYDETNNNNFYNLQLDSLEQYPIPDVQLTPAQRKIKENFQHILARMHN